MNEHKLHIVNYLNHWKSKGADIEQKVTEEFHLNFKRHRTYPNLILLKYNEIESPMHMEIVQECRGIILDENDNFKPVCFPYKKFFNAEEGHSAKNEIDFASAVKMEKLDGSIMTLYHYNGNWEVSTSGTPDAEGPLGTVPGMTFKSLFWDVWNQLGYSLPESKNHCYMFELMTKHNQIVVVHEKPRIVLHGVRNMLYLYEENPNHYADMNGWECVQSYDFGTYEAIVEYCKTTNPSKMEGFVVRDAQFRRVKIKSPLYVMIHHIKDKISASWKNMFEFWQHGSQLDPEVLAYYPNLLDPVKQIQAKVEEISEYVEKDYDKFKGIESQRDFAKEVVPLWYSNYLFSKRKKNGEGTFIDWLKQVPPSSNTAEKVRVLVGMEG